MARIKPDNSKVYYGLIMAEKAIVAVMKNDPIINVIPSGKSYSNFLIIYTDIFLIHNYLITNDEHF